MHGSCDRSSSPMVHVQISRSNESFLCHTVFYRFKSEESTLALVHPKLFWRVSTRLWSRVSCFFLHWKNMAPIEVREVIVWIRGFKTRALWPQTQDILWTRQSTRWAKPVTDLPTRLAGWVGISGFDATEKLILLPAFMASFGFLELLGVLWFFRAPLVLPGWIDMAGDILAYVGNSGMMWEKVETSVFDNVAPLRVTGNW